MKNINKSIYIIIGLISMVSFSCKKFLDQNPDNRTEINTVEKVAQLLTTAYPGRDYLTFTEAISDNSEDKGPGVGTLVAITTNPYFFQDYVGNDVGTSTAYWNASYEAIAAANQALEAIQTYNLGTPANPYKGEALVARAYAHFTLAILFAKPYEKGGANSSLGIPYVTKPETKVIQQYDRGTVQSTYDNIEKDLTEGMKLLSASAYKVPKFHFTPIAAHAFAARFYMFKGEWAKAVDEVNAVLPANDFATNIRPISTTLRNLSTPEFNAAFTLSDQRYNLLVCTQYSQYQRLNSPRYGMGQKAVSLYQAANNITGKELGYKVFFNPSAPNYITYKYQEFFYRASVNANSGQPYITMPLFTTDEALMNRAEAYAQLGENDKALADINTFLAAKVLGWTNADKITLAKIATYYNIADPKEGLIKLILDSKKVEFLQEGIRWFDMVRNRITVKHNVFDASGNETFIELPASDNRRVFQLPQEVSLSGVQLNPR